MIRGGLIQAEAEFEVLEIKRKRFSGKAHIRLRQAGKWHGFWVAPGDKIVLTHTIKLKDEKNA